MADLYEDKPDARQLGVDEPQAVSRFRPRYRALTEEEVLLHDRIKGGASMLEAMFEQVPDGREKSIAMTKLEEAVMWIVKGLTK